MLRTIRRLLIAACVFTLSATGGASAQFTSISLTPSKTATIAPCPAVTPVFLAPPVVTVPSTGSGASCTNDTQCTTLGESCTFALGSNTGFCSASGHLEVEGLHYVAGSQVDVEVTIPTCTNITAVNGVPLSGSTGTGGDVQPASVSWSFLPSGLGGTVGGQSVLRPRVRVQMSNAGDGTTSAISIQVTARTGGATATQTFKVGQVQAVNAAMHSTVAESTVRNDYVTSIYEQFGDYEQFWNDEGVRVYGVNWSELVTLANDRHAGTDMRIENGRIVFSLQAKAEKPGCNPNVWIEGAFRLVPDGDSLRLEWLKGPEARADASGVCGPLTLGIWDLMTDILADEEAIAAPFAEKISTGLGADAEGRIKVCDLCRVVDVKIGNGKVDVWTLPPSNRVRVTVRVNRGMDVTANPNQGLVIPGGFFAPLAGGGTIETCEAENGIPSTCNPKLSVDIGGAFNWWGTDVPVPNSIVYDPVYGAVVLGGRANARDRLKGVLRHTASLPAPGLAADGMIARRTGASAKVRVKNGCVIAPPASEYRIAIGVNELIGAPPARGSFDATILLADDKEQSESLFGGQSRCPAEPSSGGTLGPVAQPVGTLTRR